MKQIGVINATMTCTAAFHCMDTEAILHSLTSETMVLCKDKQDICLFIFKITWFLNNQVKKVTYLLMCSTFLITLVILCNSCLSTVSSLHSFNVLLRSCICQMLLCFLFHSNWILTSAALIKGQWFSSRIKKEEKFKRKQTKKKRTKFIQPQQKLLFKLTLKTHGNIVNY